MWFTTSWDDGHPLDTRLSDMMVRHGIAGTMYWPIRNREGLAVLAASDMRQLDAVVEVGSHTLDHVYADRAPRDRWTAQVVDGKRELEQIVGHAVEGFCYPGGKVSRAARLTVADAGFVYARTTANLTSGCGGDAFMMPTSLQFYPHSRRVLMQNFLRHRDWRRRAPLAARCVRAGSFEQRLDDALESCRHHDVFHLWGHSWEIDRFDLWKPLERFFAHVDASVPRSSRVTNAGLLRAQGLLA